MLLILAQLALFVSFAAATTHRVPQDFATIQSAINAAANSDTVLVSSGNYPENITFDGQQIVVTSNFLLSGDTADIASTRIDGNDHSSVVRIEDGEDSTAALIGFTLYDGFAYPDGGGGIRIINSSPRIEYNIIRDNDADVGGGILCDNCAAMIRHNRIHNNNFVSPLGNPGGGICVRQNAHPTIEFNEFRENRNQDGGGIGLVASTAVIRFNLFVDNFAQDIGGGIRADNSDPLIQNNTFVGNQATTGGGIALLDGSSPTIVNCIFWDNSASTGDQIHNSGGSPAVTYCCIEGGWQGQGNIATPPAFRTVTPRAFFLSAIACHDSLDSPCIDAGDPAIYDGARSCSTGLGALRCDIGAYGGWPGDSVSALNPPAITPTNFSLLSAYPNPFNASTTLLFSLKRAAATRLRVFDLQGREIMSSELGFIPAGDHTYPFAAGALTSGVYVAALDGDGEARYTKLLLLR